MHSTIHLCFRVDVPVHRAEPELVGPGQHSLVLRENVFMLPAVGQLPEPAALPGGAQRVAGGWPAAALTSHTQARDGSAGLQLPGSASTLLLPPEPLRKLLWRKVELKGACLACFCFCHPGRELLYGGYHLGRGGLVCHFFLTGSPDI